MGFVGLEGSAFIYRAFVADVDVCVCEWFRCGRFRFVADVDAFVGRCRYEPVQIWTFSVCCRCGRFVADMDVLGAVFVLS